MENDSESYRLVKTKLAHINQDCESENRDAINDLYSSIKYEGGRLRVPDFQKTANLMAGVISCKEKRFNSEISRILGSTGGFSSTRDLERSKEHVSNYFHEDQYLKRFEAFLESVERAAASYGIKFDRRAYRTDIASSLFEVGVKNSTRRALASVHAELAIHQRSESLRPSSDLPGPNDIVDLKPNFMGFGINFNALIKRLRTKGRNGKN